MKEVYENYVLVHSFDDNKNTKYLPMMNRISDWLDLTYGYN